MQVGTYPTRNFATLGPSWLQPPFAETYKKIKYIYKYIINFFNSFYSTGQVSDPIHHFSILQSPVFLLNSRYPRFCYTYQNNNLFCKVLFIPKLQSHFAEFLQHCCLIRFSILYQFTCVGLNTVHIYLSFF